MDGYLLLNLGGVMLPQLTPPLLACGLAKMLYYVHFLGRV